MDHPYQNNIKCDKCDRYRTCQWQPSGPFRGRWICHKCLRELTDALADIIKAGQKALESQIDHKDGSG